MLFVVASRAADGITLLAALAREDALGALFAAHGRDLEVVIAAALDGVQAFCELGTVTKSADWPKRRERILELCARARERLAANGVDGELIALARAIVETFEPSIAPYLRGKPPGGAPN